MKAENAVTRRLDQLQEFWDSFKANPDARICRWVVGGEEQSLIDAFFQVNADESSDTPDVFLRFDAPFGDVATYGRMLSAELHGQVEGSRAALADEGIEIGWQSVHQEEADNLAVGFLRNFFHFALSLDVEEDAVVVAFLSPKPLGNSAGWAQWLSHAAMLDLPPQIRLMVCDEAGREFLAGLDHREPVKVVSLRPPLDYKAVVRELMSEFGDQDDNCTYFRKAFFELTQRVGERDAGAIRHAAAHALRLARLIGFPHLEVSVLLTAGNGFAVAGQLETALKTLEEARSRAKAAERAPFFRDLPKDSALTPELPGGNIFAQLAVQALFFKAAALVGHGDFERALENYRSAATDIGRMVQKVAADRQYGFADGAIPFFHLTEAHRMSGYCLEQLRRPQEALAAYECALDVGESMDAEARGGTMLAFSGGAMLNICRAQGQKQAHQAVAARMNALLGEGWHKNLPVAVNK